MNPNAGIYTRDRTHCPQGHPYDEENTYLTKNNKRQCRTCTRARDYFRKYGITIEEYDEMFSKQGGRCAICGLAPNLELDQKKRLCVDHDHDTGLVRQLLCDKCNVGIAKFNEDPVLMEKAIKYIQLHRHR